MACKIFERIEKHDDVLEWQSDQSPVWCRVTAEKAHEVMTKIRENNELYWDDYPAWHQSMVFIYLWNDYTQSRTKYYYVGAFEGCGEYGHLLFKPCSYVKGVVKMRPRFSGDKIITVTGTLGSRGNRILVAATNMAGDTLWQREYALNDPLRVSRVRGDCREHLMNCHGLSPYSDLKLITRGGCLLKASQLLWSPVWPRTKQVRMRAILKQPKTQLLITQFFKFKARSGN